MLPEPLLGDNFNMSPKKERIFDGLSLGEKERSFGADSEQKYEDSETKICLPQVRSLARMNSGIEIRLRTMRLDGFLRKTAFCPSLHSSLAIASNDPCLASYMS
ncbi:hypothetical protein MTR_0228s0020 [Medicago truncatula]|uniref:Uncharacterized protein n=1 Tax=Medicago truncatula TaxID=3880 RepID=A0A072TGM5_MEDTR|nr:hypothetical protein MTR_0228s0020 [Medicago truncatula]